MVNKIVSKLTREDWLHAALQLCEQGIDKIKITTLSAELGVTSGSCCWHFQNHRELLNSFWNSGNGK